MEAPENFVLDLVAGNVKAAMAAADAKSSDLWQVPVDRIRVIDGFNVREKDDDYYAHITYLKNSIKAGGFRQDRPLSGYAAREGDDVVVYITDGHCRLEGAHGAIAEGAPIERLPVVVKQNTASMEELTLSLVTTNTGKELKPYEIAIVCKRLLNFGWEPKEIAEKLQYSPTYVDSLITLISAPAALRKLVQDGSVSAGTAIDAFKKHGGKAAEILTEALEKPQSDGSRKKRVTSRDLDKDDPKKWMKREALTMFNVLKTIYHSRDINEISEDNRTTISNLLESCPGFKEMA